MLLLVYFSMCVYVWCWWWCLVRGMAWVTTTHDKVSQRHMMSNLNNTADCCCRTPVHFFWKAFYAVAIGEEVHNDAKNLMFSVVVVVVVVPCIGIIWVHSISLRDAQNVETRRIFPSTFTSLWCFFSNRVNNIHTHIQQEQ